MMTPAKIQQSSMPLRNEKEPSELPPRNNLSHGQGSTVKKSRNFQTDPMSLGMKNEPTKNSIRDVYPIQLIIPIMAPRERDGNRRITPISMAFPRQAAATVIGIPMRNVARKPIPGS